jgi:hypothetical protein
MRQLADSWAILIEITNACRLKCAHCTCGVPHVRAPHFMDLATLQRALESLEGWRKGVGCFGGEPTLHPQFPEVCALFRRYFPREQCAVWTCGGPAYERHRAEIDRTFAMVTYNDHEADGHHQPLMIAADEVVADPVERARLIEGCWIQHHWSPMITPRGAFFCEVAATFDGLFNGPGGFPLDKGWWRRGLADIQEQRARACGSCSIPLPIQPQPDTLPFDYVSPRNAERLRAAGSPLALRGGLRIVTEVDLSQTQTRNPRFFAPTGTEHFWSRMQWRTAWWLVRQYATSPSGVRGLVQDSTRYMSLRLDLWANAVRAKAESLRLRQTRTPPPP